MSRNRIFTLRELSLRLKIRALLAPSQLKPTWHRSRTTPAYRLGSAVLRQGSPGASTKHRLARLLRYYLREIY
jgi:hypothetical protein